MRTMRALFISIIWLMCTVCTFSQIHPSQIGHAPDTNYLLVSSYTYNGKFYGEWQHKDSLILEVNDNQRLTFYEGSWLLEIDRGNVVDLSSLYNPPNDFEWNYYGDDGPLVIVQNGDEMKIEGGNGIYTVSSSPPHKLIIHADTSYLATLSALADSMATVGADQDWLGSTDNTGYIYHQGAVSIGTTVERGILHVVGNIGTDGGSHNFAWGTQAMETGPTGGYNVGLGYQALQKLTSGIHNQALGSGALRETTSGRFNVSLGYENLLNNTTGYGSVGIGGSNFRASTTGSYNVGLGNGNMTSATSASWSSGIGQGNFGTATSVTAVFTQGVNNFYDATTGTDVFAQGREVGRNATDLTVTNVYASGYRALYTASILDDINAIGYQAGYNNAYDNVTVIGRNAEATASDQVSISNEYTTVKLRNYLLNVDQDTTGKTGWKLGLASSGEIELQEVTGGSGSVETASEGLTKVGDDIRLLGTDVAPATITTDRYLAALENSLMVVDTPETGDELHPITLVHRGGNNSSEFGLKVQKGVDNIMLGVDNSYMKLKTSFDMLIEAGDDLRIVTNKPIQVNTSQYTLPYQGPGGTPSILVTDGSNNLTWVDSTGLFGGSSNNLYNTDGTLTANRTLDMDGHDLTFDNVGNVDPVTLKGDSPRFQLKNYDGVTWVNQTDITQADNHLQISLTGTDNDLSISLPDELLVEGLDENIYAEYIVTYNPTSFQVRHTELTNVQGVAAPLGTGGHIDTLVMLTVYEGNELIADVESKLTDSMAQIRSELGLVTEYGELYVYNGTASQTVATGVYEKLEAFTTIGDTSGMTASAVNDWLISDSLGVYELDFHASYSGTNSSDWDFIAYVNSTPDSSLAMSRTLGSAGAVGSASLHGILTLNAGDTVSIWITSDGNDNLTITEANLSITPMIRGTVTGSGGGSSYTPPTPENQFHIYDEFVGATNASYHINQLGWTNLKTGGSIQHGGMIFDHPGVTEIVGGTAINNYNSLSLRYQSFPFRDDLTWQGIVYWSDIDQSTETFSSWCGLNSWGATYGDIIDGAYFLIKDSDQTLFAVTEHNNSRTETECLELTGATWYNLKIVHDGTDVKFYVDGTLEATHTTNIPDNTDTVQPTFLIRSGSAWTTAPEMWLDYFGLTMTVDR